MRSVFYKKYFNAESLVDLTEPTFQIVYAFKNNTSVIQETINVKEKKLTEKKIRKYIESNNKVLADGDYELLEATNTFASALLCALSSKVN